MELGALTAGTVPKPDIWQLWLRADRQEPVDSLSRSILFRDLLRENGYVVPRGERKADPVCEIPGAACVPATCL